MSNLSRLQQAMAAANSPAILISDISNVGWVSGFTGSSAMVLVTSKDARFLTDSRYTLQAKEEVADMPSYSFASPVKAVEFMATHATEMGLTELGFEADSVTYETWTKWSEQLGGIKLVAAPNVIGPLRMRKNADEIAKVRAACKLADAAFDHVRRMLQPGATEYDLGLEIEFYFRRHGAELAFAPIVVSGERSARPHGKPSEKRLERGDFVTMDFGAKLHGQCSDLTRTVVIGEATDRHREVYNAVLEAQLESLKALKPGAAAKDVDAIARDVFKKYELDSYFGHGLGHGLGSVVHDLGRLAPSSPDMIEEGQIWTIEPGVYIPGFGGVRIEDDALVTADGNEVLTSSPKDLLICP
jgi:Xaa-Pro aminopeptidase